MSGLTVDFSQGYQPPGVYITEDTAPVVTINGIPPGVVAVVGPSVGYETHTEQIVLGSSVVLSKKGIDTTSIAVSRVDNGVVLQPTDFNVHINGTPTDGTQTYTVDLTRAGTGTLDDDTAVFVSYRFTGPDYFTPQTFDNFQEVVEAFGHPLNSTVPTAGDSTYKPVISPLALGAQLAFQAGASEVVLVPTTPPPSTASTASAISAARRDAIADAYALIDTDYAVNLLVVMTDGIVDADAPSVYADLVGHVENAAADGYFRFAILGFDPAVVTPPDNIVALSGTKSKHVSLAYATPGGMNFYNGAVNQFIALGHQYLSASLVGNLARNAYQQGLTQQAVVGFAGLVGTPLSNRLKNQYAAAGVLVVEQDRNNRILVRHGVTTDTTNVNTKEISVVRARDAMVAFIQSGMSNSGLIGTPIDENTPFGVKSGVAGLLEHLVLVGTIVKYTGLAVRVSSTDPSVIEVKFAYQPAYPLNYIQITFSINVQTGVTDFDIAA